MKKVLLSVCIVLLSGVLFACSNSSSEGASDELTPDKVIEAFLSAGLTADNSKEMTKEDYGMAPMKADEGKIIAIGNDMNARVFSFENEKDLEQTKEFYDKLGEESAMLFSWTMQHKNILIQLNGNLSEEDYNKYKEELEKL